MTVPGFRRNAADSSSPLPHPSAAGLLAIVRHPLIANAFFIWADQALGALGGFVFWLLAARLYSSEQVGVASATLSAVTLIAAVAHLGLGMGLIRTLPGAGARRDQYIRAALTLALVAASAAAVMFVAGVRLWSPELRYLQGSPWTALAFVAFAAAATGYIVLTSTYVSLRVGRLLPLLGLLGQMTRLALPPLLIGFGAFGIVIAGGLSGVVGLSAGLLLLGVVRRPFRFAPALSATATRALVPLGLANLSADVGLIAPRVVLPLMVTNLLGAESGAHFFIGFFVGVLLLTAVQALATSLFNEGSRDAAQLARAARHALLLALLVSGAGAAFLTVAGRSLLLVFGQDYADDSSGLLTLVSLAAVPAAAMYVLVATLRVRRATRAMLAVAWTGCAATLTLSFVLLPDLGIAGAGIGMLAGQSIGAAAAAVAVLRVRALV